MDFETTTHDLERDELIGDVKASILYVEMFMAQRNGGLHYWNQRDWAAQCKVLISSDEGYSSCPVHTTPSH